MTLHVALEGVDGVGKSTMCKKLMKFLSKKSYKCRLAIQPANIEIIKILKSYQLLPHEIALLMAFDRSFSYYGENWKDYDIVIWDRSILSSYVYNTDKNTPQTFIKQINRYFPSMDLYIVIRTDSYMAEQDYTHQKHYDLIKKYDQLINEMDNVKKVDYVHDKPEEVFENIVKVIFDNLPKCNWCGRLFKPTKKHKKYCKNKCKKYSLAEQYRINNRNYYHRYKNVMTERQKGALGSKGANLHGRADPNPLVELEKVRNAKRALGLKPIQ